MFESLSARFDTTEEKVNVYLALIVILALLFLVTVRKGLGKAAI